MKKVLKKNKWVSLMEIVEPEKGISGYVYSHESRCNGHIISVLPFKRVKEGVLFLLRSEVTPCWNDDNDTISSITGGVDNGHVTGTIVHEMKEEAGFNIHVDDIITLGTCFGTKSSDTVYHLASVDLTGMYEVPATGDGSELEAKAHCFWTKDISDAVDPLVYILYYRLMKTLHLS